MTAPTLVFPSFTNGTIPAVSDEVVAFARSESDWAINQYVQYVEAPTPVGVFPQLGRDTFITNPGGTVAPSSIGGGGGSASTAWVPGDDMPDGENNQVPFTLQEYRCSYRVQPWRLAYDEIKNFKFFNLKLAYMRMAATRLLTDRVNRAAGQLTTAANWGTHTATVNVLNGNRGPWSTASDDPNSAQYMAILKSLQAAARAIHIDTNGVVGQDKLHVVIGPDMAIALSVCPEIVNYCRESNVALQLNQDGFDPTWERWGIPSRYRGFHFVVEDAPIVTANYNATNMTAGGGYPSQPAMAAESTRQYIWPSGTAVMMARVGELDGEFGSRSYSTFQIFHHGGLAVVKAFDEPKHERIVGRCMEAIDLRIVANMSGFCITGVL